MTTTVFNGRNVRSILDECEAALKPIAEKHGLTLDRKGRTYRPDALPVMFQFLIKQLDANGNEMDSRAKDFIKYAASYGLKESDFLAEFHSNGEVFRIVGFKPKARKYPVLAEKVRDGKTYKFPAERVKLLLAQAKAA
jgi:hypothetical protein